MLLDEKEHAADGETFIVLTEYELIVPSHWPAEVGNALLINIRRGRLPSERLPAIARYLETFRVTLQRPPQTAEIEIRIRSALSDGLTYYDSLYVQLALERRVPLFTLDKPMRKAALMLGLTVLPAI
jgi:predicted nucleic acid-binding protein